MTTQKEALKMALKALEDMHIIDFPLENLHNWNKAIKAIKEALANSLKPRCFADFQSNHEIDRKCQWCVVETECKTGMAQQSNEQVEPVAWIEQRFYEDGTPNPCNELKWTGRNAENDFPVGTKFYIASPQSTSRNDIGENK